MKLLNLILFPTTLLSVSLFTLKVMRACCAIEHIPTGDSLIRWSNIVISCIIGFIVAYKLFPIHHEDGMQK